MLRNMAVILEPEQIVAAVRRALAEDVGTGDVTTIATVPVDSHCRGVIRAREPLVLAGISFAMTAFRELAPEVQFSHQAVDGASLERDAVLMAISGPTRAMLTAERVALNFIQRLSGVATAASHYVEAIQGTNARILDTRKTTPGWRHFEKYAAACGGAKNHRIGLFDMVLIKDNHLAALRDAQPNAIAAAVQRARTSYPDLRVEVEADTLEQAAQAAKAGADFILLDNMTVEELRSAVRLIDGRSKTEASGGVNLQTVRAIAETGVDFISVGAITHSARSVDIGFDFDNQV